MAAYCTMAYPPSLPGVKVTVAEPFPAVAVPILGDAGAAEVPDGVKTPDSMRGDAAPAGRPAQTVHDAETIKTTEMATRAGRDRKTNDIDWR